MNRAGPALDSVQRQPREAIATATALLADPTCTDAERAQARHAIGRAYHELDQLDRAVASLTEALATASAAGLSEIGGEIRLSLSASRLAAGDTDAARQLVAEAEPLVHSARALGRLSMQRGLIEHHTGEFDAAIASLDKAQSLIESADDDRDEVLLVRILVNRGIALTMTGDLDRGTADFERGQELAEALGQPMLSAGAAQNLGFVASRRGDVRAALDWFGKARAGYAAVGSPRRVVGTLETDLCSALLSGGLYKEATAAAKRAIEMTADSGNKLNEAEARLLLARVRLADRSFTAAEHEAARAADLFRSAKRGPWSALADYLGLQAAAGSQTGPSGLAERAVSLVEPLRSSGWVRESLEVQTFAGRLALQLGRLDEARSHLAQAASARDQGSFSLRADAWLAAATLHLADDDRDAARAAVSTGMSIVEDHRATLGSSELRAHASINAAELATLGLRLATEDGDADEVWRWAERWHAGALRTGPAPTDSGDELARALTELRQAHAAATGPSADPVEADTDTDRVIAALERRILDLSRRASAEDPRAGEPDETAITDLAAVQAKLGADSMVEYFAIDDQLHAIAVTDEAVRTVEIGPVADVGRHVRAATSTAGRLAFPTGSDAARNAALTGLSQTTTTLDELLVAPLGLADSSGEVVIVPTGPLQALPWGQLPSLSERGVTVAPSAGLWARAQRAAVPAGDEQRALLACGPNLTGGSAEIERLRTLYPQATVLTGADATVPAVLAGMEEADIVHIAAHGTFRADNPMFSALELSDGPLTVFDVESLSVAPTTVVLPACDAGRSSVRDGDELLGTASALVQVGVSTVVAPLTVVADSTVTWSLMVELHRRLREGARPATALAEARRQVATGPAPDHAVSNASFVAIGVRR